MYLRLSLRLSTTPGSEQTLPREAPVHRVVHRRPFFRRQIVGLLCGKGTDPPRGCGRPSGARESQVYNENMLKDSFGHHNHVHYRGALVYMIRILKLTFTPIVFVQVSAQFNAFHKPKNASQENEKNTNPPSMGQIETVRTSSHATDIFSHSRGPRWLGRLSSCLLENQLREFISHRVHILVGSCINN